MSLLSKYERLFVEVILQNIYPLERLVMHTHWIDSCLVNSTNYSIDPEMPFIQRNTA